MSALDRLEAALGACVAGEPNIIRAAMAYQNLLHEHGADLIAVARAAQLVYEHAEDFDFAADNVRDWLADALAPLLADPSAGEQERK